MCGKMTGGEEGKRGPERGQEENGGTLTTTTRFATEIDPVAATANASHCSKGFIIMQHAALHGNTVKGHCKGKGRGHNSCAKKPKPMANKKKREKNASCQRQSSPRNVQVRFNQMGKHAPQNWSETVWCLWPDGRQGEGEGSQRTTHVGLTIGEISSKTIKNWQHKKRCWHIDLSGMLLCTAQMRPQSGWDWVKWSVESGEWGVERVKTQDWRLNRINDRRWMDSYANASRRGHDIITNMRANNGHIQQQQVRQATAHCGRMSAATL